MGHLEFRRAIQLLDPADRKSRPVLHAMDRPGRPWRRLIGRVVYEHQLFGNVILLATDGCHAVVETVDGEREKVCFENLTEYVGVPVHPKLIKPAEEKKPKVREEKRKQEVNSILAKLIPGFSPTTTTTTTETE